MKKKNSDISIKKVTGNVIISQGQQGGVTAHEINPIEKKTEKKSFFQNKYVQLIGLVSAVLGTLSYFGFQPDTKNTINNQNTVKEMPIKDTIKTLKEKLKRKTEVKSNMNKDDDNTEKENPISVQNITGDVVISQNQSGGQTAKTIINQIPEKRNILEKEDILNSYLKKSQPVECDIHILMNDLEAYDLAIQIKAVLDNAGWKTGSIIKGLGGYYPPGITITRDKESNASDNLLEGLFLTGLKNVTGQQEFKGNKIAIYIGPNPDNYRQ
jgi:hypothetical protein